MKRTQRKIKTKNPRLKKRTAKNLSSSLREKILEKAENNPRLTKGINKAWKGYLEQALRKATFSYAPFKKARKKTKIDSALDRCPLCQRLIYSGSSDKNYRKMIEKYPEEQIIRGIMNLDHIQPVVDPNNPPNWHEYIDRMFCGEEGVQHICEFCHEIKTNQENNERRS